jgi:hypothetical protein
MILKIFSPKKFPKNGVFWLESTAKFCEKWIIQWF